MKIKLKKLDERAILPKYAKAGDAGLDFFSLDAGKVTFVSDIPMVEYSTGIAMEIPKGYVGLIFPRSSITANSTLSLGNAVGVIDSGYRGEIKFQFRDLSRVKGKKYKAGDKIGQMIIIPYPEITFEEVNELSDSERGSGGFGSTGI